MAKSSPHFMENMVLQRNLMKLGCENLDLVPSVFPVKQTGQHPYLSSEYFDKDQLSFVQNGFLSTFQADNQVSL